MERKEKRKREKRRKSKRQGERKGELQEEREGGRKKREGSYHKGAPAPMNTQLLPLAACKGN